MSLHYADYEYLLASSQLAFAMFGMGALLLPGDFAVVFGRPRSLIVGLSLQLVIVPLVAIALAAALPLPVGVAAGIALVAAVPGGTMSNVLTYFARGNIALSISLTAVTTVASLLTTPLLLRWLAGTHLPAEFEMPVGRVALEIGVVLLCPLAAGMGFGALQPAWRDAISRWSIRTSLLLIAAMVVGSAAAGRLDAGAYGLLGPVAIVAFGGALQACAWLFSWLAALRFGDRVTIGIEVTVRNTNLALMVKASLFPVVTGVPDPVADGMFFVALLYGGCALPLAMLPMLLGRRRVARGH